MIEKPGTLTRLNSLFDDGAVTDLINGEKIKRNKDTIVIMTTNLDYVGCGNFNQSVLSRMSMIQPKQNLTEEEMKPLGIKSDNVSIDFTEGDTIVVVAGAWKDTVGAVYKIDYNKQTVTINVELFGRDTPVEISFSEVRKLD